MLQQMLATHCSILGLFTSSFQTQQLWLISICRGVRVIERLFGQSNRLNVSCVFLCAGAAAAAVYLPEPGSEAAGEPEPEQKAGGGRGRGRQGGGSGRGGQERPRRAHGHDATGQGPGAVSEEDGHHGGLNISDTGETNVGTDL